MPPTPKRWEFLPVAARQHSERFSHLHPLLAQILYNRGIADSEDVEAFLTSRVRFDDPFKLSGMTRAVGRIRAALRSGHLIVVYGDFDADGVTATALLVQTLEAMGARVHPYIPHRVDEGYGLNCDALDRIAAAGARLVITVDCGIRSPVEVAYGNNLGLDMIVTDHHAVGPELPPAISVINPKQEGDPYPFKDLAGVGLAFKLSQALLLEERRHPSAAEPPALEETDLIDLVALGTVADLAPLLGENRSLVQRGLAELNAAPRPGIKALLAEAGVKPGRVDAAAIGFVLGPRLNAAGRLSTAEISYRLLTAPDQWIAAPLAAELGRLNTRRQELTAEKVALARDLLQAEGVARSLYFVADPAFSPGVVGLVAGKLADDLYRPVLVAELGQQLSHGSARSIPEFNITAALDECRDLLERHGGHAAAAGFTIRNERLDDLRRRLEGIADRQLAGQELAPTLQIDAVVELADLDWAAIELLAQLEPCGYANPQPVFASSGLEVVEQRTVGRESQHLKLTVRDPAAMGPEARLVRDAIAFRMGEWSGCLPPRIDLAYTFETNEFNGAARLQLNVKDLRPARPFPMESEAR
jgi:single-stranded-DNA-specific exonuclease